jgi:hypothetical protein
MRLPLAFSTALVITMGCSTGTRAVEVAGSPVSIMALPAGGIQPQAIVDASDVLHVLYFSGPPAAGDLFYVRREAGAAAFSSPLRVNSVPGSALATGTMRGGQFALGRNGRIHVAWHGAAPIEIGGAKRTPVWYSRLNTAGTAFDPQLNVAVVSTGLDGDTVAADNAGNVYVAWHGLGEKDGEANRTVYIAKSHDDGAKFAPEEPAANASTGACGCCGLRAIADGHGTAHILYRAATEGVHRDATWLTLSADKPAPIVLQPWKLEACPMSTFAAATDGEGLIAAWETEQQVYYSRLNPSTRSFTAPVAMEGSGSRKHPSVATNAAGMVLMAWTEGTGWARGGTMAWEILDREGKRVAKQSKAAPVPVWGLVAAAARRDGSFVIVR